MKPVFKTLLVAGAAVAMLTLSPFANAQTFPNKPVTMIVAFPAGGGSDVLGRMVAKSMQDVVGQPVIVENIVGVGGSLGVLKAAYTALANPETRKSIEASGTVIAEPMSVVQLDAFYKKEAATGAAIAKSINLQAQ